MNLKKIAILNGPNLNLIGKREINLYGKENFQSYLDKLKKYNKYRYFEISYYHHNHEGGIIDILHKIGFNYDGIILNAGAYSHNSIAIYDAIKSIITPVIEVHITNIYARESFRKNSLIAKACKGSIIGFGLKSYELALISFL